MIILECHTFLDTETQSVIEIELTELPVSTAQKYNRQWFLVNKSNLDIKVLQFRSMDSTQDIEERFFDLGYLKFDSQKGVYISKEPTMYYQLKNNSPEKIPQQTMEAVARYLNGKNIVFL